MRNHGTEDYRTDGGGIDASVRAPGSEHGAQASDVVYDFSDLERMRIQDLTVLLTARQMAMEEDRTVWATGVQMRTWRILHAMGLGGYFKRFPTSDIEQA